MGADSTDWLQKGFNYTWLPYARMKSVSMPLEVVEAKGSLIFLADGSGLVDGLSNWWTICHGHRNEYLIDKCIAQIQKLPHVSFCGLASSESFRLASRLVDLLDNHLKHVFFSDSGSTAVEVAMRIAFQYYQNLALNGRNKFIFFSNAYHGDTMGCVSVSDPSAIHGDRIIGYAGQNFMFNLQDVLLPEFENAISGISNSVAAIIIEPLVQAAGGMKFHTPEILQKLRNISNKFNILLIADEVAVGFSRLGGSVFASKKAGITPDILVLGKSITGGFCAFGTTVVSDGVYEPFYSDDPANIFTYGSTFMGNPVSCAAANASLDLFERNNYYLDQIFAIEKTLTNGLSDLIKYSVVLDVRVMGAIGVVEVNKRIDLERFTEQCLQLGVWLRPLGNIIYIMPSYTITIPELEKLIYAVRTIVCNMM